MIRNLLVGVALGLTACTALMDPKMASVTRPESRQTAYTHVFQQFARLGPQGLMGSPETGVITGTLHNAVGITLTLVAVPEGTRVEIVCTPLPNKLAVGTFDECETVAERIR
jgi:hypothetical protein